MLQITPHAAGDVTVLKLTGQLIYGVESRSLAEHVKMQVAGGNVRILLDLSSVGFIDSGGVGEIVACFSSVRRADGQLKMCGATEMVKKVLKIVRLPTMISLFNTEADAVASFAVPPTGST
ncbi:MAG: STAS domain-containing protein [Planctomycetota bacterium]|nr:STAS domain-containing protein [Planctomycetota bacterium]